MVIPPFLLSPPYCQAFRALLTCSEGQGTSTVHPNHGDSFMAVAWEHLKSLENAGESHQEIESELSAVARAYAADGLVIEAEMLRELVRQYRGRWMRRDVSGSAGCS